MFRKIALALGCLGALALSGCVTSGSKMDLAPFETRPAAAPFAVGDYCNVENEDGADLVRSRDECVQVSWDRRARRFTYTMVDDGKTIVLPVSVTPFRNGVLFAQADRADIIKLTDEPAEKSTRKDDDTPPHMHAALLVVGGAMINLGWDATAEDMDALAARHPKIKVEGKGTSRVIAEGSRQDALDYVWDLLMVSLKKEGRVPAILAKDRLGAANHAPSKAQSRDIKAALAKIDALKR
jgi:hypothetical protein